MGGPLTRDITADSFSDRSVPFTWITWLLLALFYLIFLAHEVYAIRGASPLLASKAKANTLIFQASLLFYWFYAYVNEAMLIPVTLDFAASMGHNATMSGFFISCSLLASILGVSLGKYVVSEDNWDQRRARRFVV